MSKHDIVFDIIESEANVNIFLDRENFKAEGAAITITSSYIGHRPIRPKDKYTVWFGRGIDRSSFPKFKDACFHAIKIIKSSKKQITPRAEGRDAKKFLRIYNKDIQYSEFKENHDLEEKANG